ncbi:hypothetical protein OJF2_77420 [Aquisphaera giovannonii]|uniref:Uncharacterized protein n=1 Tax=Aquisphaera giovannonii TaxID=406548 RepID=A0A5B9WH13_9BACT|nr:hypothetical protein OJF2_77420 [Aquisphaera giovannonii]
MAQAEAIEFTPLYPPFVRWESVVARRGLIPGFAASHGVTRHAGPRHGHPVA